MGTPCQTAEGAVGLEFSCAQLAEITAGTLTSTTDPEMLIALSGITTDSRQCAPGALYVAKQGEVSDGHTFISAAFHEGAVAVLAQKNSYDAEGKPYPGILVADPVKAMGAIAAATVRMLREEGELAVVGITGSVGKTTTKDLLAGILSSVAPTVAPYGSYNGEVGVPLTVFRLTRDTRYLVVEMGATHVGHIRYLTEMTRPDVGVVLGIGSAHRGEFGSTSNIIQAKGELIEGLTSKGHAVLNSDDLAVTSMAERTQAQLVWFGGKEEHRVDGTGRPIISAHNIATDDQARPSCEVRFPDGFRRKLRSGLIGEHQVINIVAAAAAAWSLGIAPERIVSGLMESGPRSRWRMERTERADEVSVLNDAYNASPESTRAALRTLASLAQGKPGEVSRRTWAVLGPMYELGEDSVAEHHALGQVLVRLRIARLLVVGARARPLYLAALQEGLDAGESLYAENIDEAYSVLDEHVRPGDLLLFKGSHDAQIWKLGDWVARGSKTAQDLQKASRV